LGEVRDSEPDIDVGDEQSSLENDVLGKAELTRSAGVELLDQRTDLLAGVPVLPLVGGHGQKQVRVRQGSAAAVDPNEDVQDFVRVLVGFQVIVNRPGHPERLVKVV